MLTTTESLSTESTKLSKHQADFMKELDVRECEKMEEALQQFAGHRESITANQQTLATRLQVCP
jgi:hypothetical protein